SPQRIESAARFFRQPCANRRGFLPYSKEASVGALWSCPPQRGETMPRKRMPTDVEMEALEVLYALLKSPDFGAVKAFLRRYLARLSGAARHAGVTDPDIVELA